MENDKKISRLQQFKKNLLKDWIKIATILIITTATIFFIFKKNSSLLTVILLASYVICFLLTYLLNSNVISENDKISFNVKITVIVVAIIISATFYKQNFNFVSSLIGISLLFDLINQSVKIYYFHKKMVAVNELVIYRDDKDQTNEPISPDVVLEIISKIRPHYEFLHKNIKVDAIDGEMANRVREILVSREKQSEQLDTMHK